MSSVMNGSVAATAPRGFLRVEEAGGGRFTNVIDAGGQIHADDCAHCETESLKE